jgi:sec-independent protein translocase protein TatA
MMPTLFGILDFGTGELIAIGLFAVMLFGKNLPEVGRSVGQKLAAFRRGWKGIEEEIRTTTGGLITPGKRISSALSTLDALTKDSSPKSSSSSSPAASASYARPTVSEAVDDLVEPTAPKFEPPK